MHYQGRSDGGAAVLHHLWLFTTAVVSMGDSKVLWFALSVLLLVSSCPCCCCCHGRAGAPIHLRAGGAERHGRQLQHRVHTAKEDSCERGGGGRGRRSTKGVRG